MANQQWKKNLGFLESIMFDPVTSGILGLGEGIMSLFGVSEKNSQIDALKNDYEKMKFTEDQMARRQSDVKRLYGNSVDSMIGAGGLLNGDTAREIAKTKTFMESAKAMLDQRMKDEQVNLGITDKINQLEGQKSGYIPSVMGMLSGGLQGVFGATQASMGMDRQEAQDKLLENYMNPNKAETVISSLTGEELNPVKRNTSLDTISNTNLTPEKIDLTKFLSNQVEDDLLSEENILANYISEESNLLGDIFNPKQNSRNSEPQIFNRKLNPLDVKKYSSIDLMPKISKLFSNRRRF